MTTLRIEEKNHQAAMLALELALVGCIHVFLSPYIYTIYTRSTRSLPSPTLTYLYGGSYRASYRELNFLNAYCDPVS